MAQRKRQKKEKVYTGMALQTGWQKITADRGRVWWFYTTEKFAKRWSLDGQGVPICWDDEEYTVQEVRQGTGDDVCTAILNNDHEEKLMLLISTDMPAVLIQGKDCHEVSWADYTKEGLYAVKKAFPHTRLEAVIINPKIATLQSFGVVKHIIQGIVEETDFFKEGKSNESASEEA